MRIRSGILIALITMGAVSIAFAGVAQGGASLPPIVVVPGEVGPGGTFNVSGEDCEFVPDSSAEVDAAAFDPATVDVAVSFSPTPVTVTVNTAAGSWAVDITVPEGTLPGAYTVSAVCDDKAPVDETSAQALFPYADSSVTVVAAQAADAIVAAPRTTG
jgi:hypothetical protein